jgi:multisubunit Na+/H+ antiporter MnhF subunit
VNLWITAAAGMIFALIPLGIVVFHGDPVERLVGLEMAGMIDTLLIVLLAEGFHQPSFYDLALALALLALGGGLVFTRFLERWL